MHVIIFLLWRFWWHLAHLESDIRHTHYSSDITTVWGKLSCCFHYLCWGLVTTQNTDSNDFTENQRCCKHHFCRGFWPWRGLGFFYSIRTTAWFKMLVFSFAMNLQDHFQQHMLAIHWQDTSDLLEVTFWETMKLIYFYNVDMLFYPSNNYLTFTRCQWILTEWLWFLLVHVTNSQ